MITCSPSAIVAQQIQDPSTYCTTLALVISLTTLKDAPVIITRILSRIQFIKVPFQSLVRWRWYGVEIVLEKHKLEVEGTHDFLPLCIRAKKFNGIRFDPVLKRIQTHCAKALCTQLQNTVLAPVSEHGCKLFQLSHMRKYLHARTVQWGKEQRIGVAKLKELDCLKVLRLDLVV